MRTKTPATDLYAACGRTGYVCTMMSARSCRQRPIHKVNAQRRPEVNNTARMDLPVMKLHYERGAPRATTACIFSACLAVQTAKHVGTRTRHGTLN